MFRAAVPSGASTGHYEAVELRDNKADEFLGKGVATAVANVNTLIKQALVGRDVTNQKAIDDELNKLDGTENKGRLGANAILGVSMAVCRAGLWVVTVASDLLCFCAAECWFFFSRHF